MQTAVPKGLDEATLLPQRYETYAHPVEEIELKSLRREEMLQTYALQHVYGSHMPMRLEMEKRLLSQFQRLPVLRSELAGLETLSKRDIEMDFGDGFGYVEPAEAPLELHALTEQRLRL